MVPFWFKASSINNREEEKVINSWTLSDALDPNLPATGEQPKNYTIEDHHYLVERSHTRHLFEEFRREVLAIDPCISEEFLKLYVAYKAETNFVDVVPQAARLRLSLNMRFHELHDPRGLANDVTNIGRWGNGDVEVRVKGLPKKWPAIPGSVLTLAPSISAASLLISVPSAALEITASVNLWPFRAARV